MKARQAALPQDLRESWFAVLALAAPYRPRLNRLPAERPKTRGISVSVHPSGAIDADDRRSCAQAGEPLQIEFAGEEALALMRDHTAFEKEAQRWIFIHGDWARSA